MLKMELTILFSFSFFNYFTQGKSIKPLRHNEFLRVKETEKPLSRERTLKDQEEIEAD